MSWPPLLQRHCDVLSVPIPVAIFIFRWPLEALSILIAILFYQTDSLLLDGHLFAFFCWSITYFPRCYYINPLREGASLYAFQAGIQNLHSFSRVKPTSSLSSRGN